jgi:hypothetical protein
MGKASSILEKPTLFCEYPHALLETYRGMSISLERRDQGVTLQNYSREIG